MILIIPVDEDKQSICPSFGRTPYFFIHNTETDESSCEINPAANAEGGAGLKAAQFVVDSKASVLITPRCGENAAEVLKGADIKIYKSEGSDSKTNIKLFIDNQLEELTHFHAGYHGIH